MRATVHRHAALRGSHSARPPGSATRPPYEGMPLLGSTTSPSKAPRAGSTAVPSKRP